MTYDLHGPVTTVQVESTVDILDPDCCRRVRFRSTPFEAVRSVFSRYCWPGGLPSFCLVCTDAALGLAHFLNLHVYYCTLYFTSVDDWLICIVCRVCLLISCHIFLVCLVCPVFTGLCSPHSQSAPSGVRAICAFSFSHSHFRVYHSFIAFLVGTAPGWPGCFIGLVGSDHG